MGLKDLVIRYLGKAERKLRDTERELEQRKKGIEEKISLTGSIVKAKEDLPGAASEITTYLAKKFLGPEDEDYENDFYKKKKWALSLDNWLDRRIPFQDIRFDRDYLLETLRKLDQDTQIDLVKITCEKTRDGDYKEIRKNKKRQSVKETRDLFYANEFRSFSMQLLGRHIAFSGESDDMHHLDIRYWDPLRTNSSCMYTEIEIEYVVEKS